MSNSTNSTRPNTTNLVNHTFPLNMSYSNKSWANGGAHNVSHNISNIILSNSSNISNALEPKNIEVQNVSTPAISPSPDYTSAISPPPDYSTVSPSPDYSKIEYEYDFSIFVFLFVCLMLFFLRKPMLQLLESEVEIEFKEIGMDDGEDIEAGPGIMLVTTRTDDTRFVLDDSESDSEEDST